MSLRAASSEAPSPGVPGCPPSSELPADRVLSSGAVLFPGVFDQHGCPLVLFPVESQDKLSQLSQGEVVDFIQYFLCVHSRKQEKQSLVSVVADLRDAPPPTARFIAEVLLQLQQRLAAVHSAYILQPRKKAAVRLVQRLLAPSKPSRPTAFRKILLKEVSELSNYIDRSQLPASLGGYFLYCHKSWVGFVKEVHAFLQEFLSVLQRLPSCISTLQALSRLPLPSSLSLLQNFCSTNEATFLHLRRELGLDELLRHCEVVVDKLRFPEKDPCFQAMAGTALFTHTAFDMLQNHSRITAAVERVELLWRQASSRAQLHLQLVQFRSEALQITEKIAALQEKLQLYTAEIDGRSAKGVASLSEFETNVYSPAMVLIHHCEEVIHTLEETLPLEAQTRESWVQDLERLKDNLHLDVTLVLQTLRAVSDYHHYYNKANSWCRLVLSEDFLQELLSAAHRDHLSSEQQTVWRRELSTFLKKNPAPDMEELVHLVHLSSAIPDEQLRQAGRRIYHRCVVLRKLLISSGPVLVDQLQLALQWQTELMHGGHVTWPSEAADVHCSSAEAPSPAGSGSVSVDQKPRPLEPLDSGFNGGGWAQLEVAPQRSAEAEGSVRCTLKQLHRHEEGVSGGPDHVGGVGPGSEGNSCGESIPILPEVEAEVLKLSAAAACNPWLSRPVDGLESPDTVTQRDHLGPRTSAARRTRMEVMTCTASTNPQSGDGDLDSDFSDPEPGSADDILSSSTADRRDAASRSTEVVPTLLWDSHPHPETSNTAYSGTDVSLTQWEEEEQESLRQVEKILDRAGGILQEEENVLAQEKELDVLLEEEDRREVWWWDGKDKPGMRSSEPAEAGEPQSSSELESDESSSEGEWSSGELLSSAPEGPDLNRLGLKDLNSRSRCSDPRLIRDGEAFRLQLEKERREVEALEKSLYKEQEPTETPRDGEDAAPSVRSTESAGRDWCQSEGFRSFSGLEVEDPPSPCRGSGFKDPMEDAVHPQPRMGDTESGDGLGAPPASGRRLDDVGAPDGEAAEGLVISPNVKELTTNNNNNKKLLTSDCCDGPSHAYMTPRVLPGQPLESDPGRTHWLSDGFQRSDVVRRSSCGSEEAWTRPTDDVPEVWDLNVPVVLDTGSGLMKAGFADQDGPKTVFPNIIGVPKYEEIMNGNPEGGVYVGHDAQHMRGVLALKHPIQNGIISSWDDMEKIWHHTFQLMGVEPEEHPVLLTEAAMNPLENRQRMVEIMFESFNVPLTYVAMQAVLALYATGRTTGVVFDSGDGVSHSVPVFEGYCLPHAVQRFPLAGVDVTTQLKKLLQEQGVSMCTSAENEIAREIKERCCCVALDYQAAESSCREMHYTMPDGQIVTLRTERFRAPEILFKPQLIGREHYGMHESISKSIQKSDIDLRRSLLGNIVLSGGNTLLPGLPERLQAEIKALVPAEVGGAIRVTSPKNRDCLVWRGGAVLANLPTFSSAWISQKEYEENGPRIVFRKCF
ncbi:uncharacterized protein [Nothobranchius furzeri]|uniref:uncharacterized protein isoform X2 n=1 Tax=Nothobranchius furzeri TaxID=105023 RepID=UPI00240475EB|nr:uncharacterized protein si:ch211-241j12.3 isoform X2 [Nothobranchius furzeri]